MMAVSINYKTSWEFSNCPSVTSFHEGWYILLISSYCVFSMVRPASGPYKLHRKIVLFWIRIEFYRLKLIFTLSCIRSLEQLLKIFRVNLAKGSPCTQVDAKKFSAWTISQYLTKHKIFFFNLFLPRPRTFHMCEHDAFQKSNNLTINKVSNYILKP